MFRYGRPYTNVTASGELSDNPFQYTGRENDGTGLYYYRARYYSPKLQRFISEDPIGFAGGDVNLYSYADSVGTPPSIETNLYSYTFNNPVNYIDPEGEFPWLPVIGGIALGSYIWVDIIYPLLKPEEAHEAQPHLECEPSHPVDPRTLPPQRLPKQPPRRLRPYEPYRTPVRR